MKKQKEMRRRRETLKQARERGEQARKRRGQSEIIIIIEVVFEGQYLRFSSAVSLKHNPPRLSPPRAPQLPPGKLLSPPPSPAIPMALCLSLFPEKTPTTVSHPPGHCPSQSYSRQLRYSFSNTRRIKWAINKQTREPPVSQRRNKVTGHQTTSCGPHFTGL